MARIKKTSSTPLISTSKLSSDRTVAFSFKHLTSRKEYNFEGLDKGKNREWHSALVDRIMQISKEPWLTWLNTPKETGIETIRASQLNFSPSGYEFSPDEKVFIFRFNSQSGRIIGIKERESPVYFVIGFDMDFSAYDHG